MGLFLYQSTTSLAPQADPTTVDRWAPGYPQPARGDGFADLGSVAAPTAADPVTADLWCPAYTQPSRRRNSAAAALFPASAPVFVLARTATAADALVFTASTSEVRATAGVSTDALVFTATASASTPAPPGAAGRVLFRVGSDVYLGTLVSGPSPGAPDVPTGLAATPASATSAALTWDATDGATSYVVERSTAASAETTIATPATNSYTDTGLTPETFYYYRVTAVNGSGSSPASLYDWAKTYASSGGTLATVGYTAGWATHGLAFPRGALPSGGTPQVGSLDTQWDLKNSHSDGSGKFGLVTCKPTSTGNLAVASGAAASGSFTPTVPAVVMTFTETSTGTDVGSYPVVTHGSPWVYTATLPTTVPGSGLWLTGPLVKEWSQTVTPVRTDDASNTAHPFLRVVFGWRVYSDGQYRLEAVIENVRNDALSTLSVASIGITVGGSSVYTHASTSHYWQSRARIVVRSAVTESTITPDVAALQRAGAIPAYESYVQAIADYSSGTTPFGGTFDLYGRGNLPASMSGPGEDTRFGVISGIGAKYVAHPTLAGQLAAVLADGELAGSWRWHVRMADGLPPNVDDPTQTSFWYVQDATYGPHGDWAATNPEAVPEQAHIVSMSFLPYMITGDQYHADEMRFAAAWTLAGCAGNGDGTRKDFIDSYIQTRAWVWGCRSLGHAAAYLPDSDTTYRTLFLSHLQANLDIPYVQTPSAHFGIVAGTPTHSSPTPNETLPTWQIGYFTGVVLHLDGFGLGTAATRSLRTAARNTAQFVLSLFTQGADFDRDYACSLYGSAGGGASGYVVVVYFPSGTVTGFYTTYADMFSGIVDGVGDPAGPFTRPTEKFGYAPHSWLTSGLAARFGLAGSAVTRVWLGTRANTDLSNVLEYGFYLCPGIAVSVPPNAGSES